MKTKKKEIRNLADLRKRKIEILHERQKLMLQLDSNLDAIKYDFKSKFSWWKTLFKTGKFLIKTFSSKSDSTSESTLGNGIVDTLKTYVTKMIAKFVNGRKESV